MECWGAAAGLRSEEQSSAAGFHSSFQHGTHTGATDTHVFYLTHNQPSPFPLHKETIDHRGYDKETQVKFLCPLYETYKKKDVLERKTKFIFSYFTTQRILERRGNIRSNLSTSCSQWWWLQVQSVIRPCMSESWIQGLIRNAVPSAAQVRYRLKVYFGFLISWNGIPRPSLE